MKKRNVYELEESLSKFYKILTIVDVSFFTIFILSAILTVLTSQQIFFNIMFIVGIASVIIAAATLPLTIKIERKKYKLRDKKSCYKTFSRF